MKKIIPFFVLLIMSSASHAELAGKKVIFIHGFQSDALFNLDNPNREQINQAAARKQTGEILFNVYDDFIYHDASKRLAEVSDDLRLQVKRIESEGTCKDGCIFVAASLGDLFARHIYSRLGQWGVDKNKFKILLSFDIVGAGGGTEGADVLVNSIQETYDANTLLGTAVRALIGTFLLGRFDSPNALLGSNLGIVNDLRPSVARRTDTQANIIPRLRVAGGGTDGVASWFIDGRDDGVIPMHSACGSARQESIDTCSRSIDIDGKLGSNNSGPSSLWPNHFPILMATDMKHQDADYAGQLVAINNNQQFGPIDFSIKEKERTTGWWIFKKRFRTVDKPSSVPLSQFFIDEFNN